MKIIISESLEQSCTAVASALTALQSAATIIEVDEKYEALRQLAADIVASPKPTVED